MHSPIRHQPLPSVPHKSVVSMKTPASVQQGPPQHSAAGARRHSLVQHASPGASHSSPSTRSTTPLPQPGAQRLCDSPLTPITVSQR
eukprot:scaffold162168_cov25-Tisochrysis_lutea.AAC.4